MLGCTDNDRTLCQIAKMRWEKRYGEKRISQTLGLSTDSTKMLTDTTEYENWVEFVILHSFENDFRKWKRLRSFVDNIHNHHDGDGVEKIRERMAISDRFADKLWAEMDHQSLYYVTA